LGDRIHETVSGEVSQVVVNVFGDDLDQLDGLAKRVEEVLNNVPGHADVNVARPSGAPTLSVHLRPERLAQFGFQPVPVLEAVQTAFQGTDIAQVVRGTRIRELAVVLADSARRDPEAV